MAIAFDAVDAGLSNNDGTTTVFTLAHTCTGSDLTLCVGIYKDIRPNATITSVTYNGTAMTLAKEQTTANLFEEYMYILTNPSTGTHNIVVTIPSAITGTQQIGIIGTSYTGTSGTQPDSTGGASALALSTNFAISTTVGVSNCWVVTSTNNDGGLLTGGGSGTTSRGSAGNGWIGDTNGTVGTGSQTVNWTKSSAGGYDTGIAISLAPLVVSTAKPAFLLNFM